MERGREQWKHTAAINAQLVAVNADPKKTKKVRPEDFNPWEGGKDTPVGEVPHDFTALRGLTRWRGP